MILADPAGGEGKQGEPEEQVQVGPQDAAGHPVDGVQHVVVVVPVDADVHETEEIAEEYRQHRHKGGEFGAVGHLHLQNHDGDDDGDHAVAKGFQSVLFHRALLYQKILLCFPRSFPKCTGMPGRGFRSLLQLKLLVGVVVLARFVVMLPPHVGAD